MALFACCPVMAQRVITLNTGEVTDGINEQCPSRSVEQTDDGYIVKYTFDKATLKDDDIYPGKVFWDIKGFYAGDIPGKPAALYRVDSYTVPSNLIYTVNLIDSSYVDLSYSLAPARPPLADSGRVAYTKDNVPEIVAYKGFFPGSAVVGDETSEYRGIRVANVCVSPVEYNYEKGILRAFKSLTYKLTFSYSNEEARAAKKSGSIKLDESDSFLDNNTINGDITKADIEGETSTSGKGYLIISTSKYQDAVQKFSTWKKLLGFNVQVVLNDSLTSEKIKSIVSDCYNNTGNLYYLLLVGDNNDVPACKYQSPLSDHKGTYVTDFYYSCLGGPYDRIPDIEMGRLPVSSPAEADIVVDKIISYEQSPVDDDNFYKEGLNCAYFEVSDQNDSCEHSRFTHTSEDIRDVLIDRGKVIHRVYFAEDYANPLHWNPLKYGNGESIPDELKRPQFKWNGNNLDIINYINRGVFYVFHRDHGDTTSWNHPAFNTDDIEKLNNGNKLPIVFSINCSTGIFDVKDNFCASFLKKRNGGCVAIIGPSFTSFSGYNDILAEGLFDAIWPSEKLRPKLLFYRGHAGITPTPTYELGQILNQGKVRLGEYCTIMNSFLKFTKEIFHCFGDPSMMIYTSKPTPFEHVEINRENNSVSVNLHDSVGTISFYNLITGKNEATKASKAIYPTSNPYNVSVCISGHNKVPYIDEGCIYIQDTTITGPKIFQASKILVGESVTNNIPKGTAIFKSGKINLKGNDIIINNGTVIKKQAELIMSNSKKETNNEK